MCAGTSVAAWQARCIQDLQQRLDARPALLIIDDVPRGDRPMRPNPARHVLWALYERSILLRRSRAERAVDLAAEWRSVPRVYCRRDRRGDTPVVLAHGDVKRVRRHGLDVILKLTLDEVGGEILDAARHGVWAFEHGPNERVRSFWEVYRGDPVTRVSLTRLGEARGRDIVLHEGWFRTITHSLVASRDAARFGVGDWPSRALCELELGAAAGCGTRVGAAAGEHAGVSRPLPSNARMAVFAMRQARRAGARVVRGLIRPEQWTVGVVQAPIHAFLEAAPTPPPRWLPAPSRRHYLADPFGLPRPEGPVVLCERYDFRRRRGEIVSLTLGGDAQPSGPVLPLEGHASYPYLVATDGEVYCIPENHQSRSASLYRAVRFPDRWERVATLVEGIAVVDPTVFRHEGRWWLVCTDENLGSESKLHAYYAGRLHGPWTPHLLNPVKTDARSSRPAGTPFVHQGRLIRPAQDDSRSYGGAVVLNEVAALTPTTFSERVVARVEPDASGPYRQGLHTLSAVGDTTLVDGKRQVFGPHNLLGRLSQLVEALARRRRAGGTDA